ncbi:MAG: L-rhamnose mutarotase [Bacteroidetes bacterium]|nr:L-rhamnose mutarotase [Bacteroidota bacterium]
MNRYCFALDLVDESDRIAAYDDWHRKVWPEIIGSITASGITQMQIYRVANRLFMIMEVNDSFRFEEKASADAGNPKVQEWEQLMWQFQQALPFARPGEKWVLMNKIFDLEQDYIQP